MTSSQELYTFTHECFLKHNELRQQHGVNPLKRDPSLDFSAQSWAEELLELDVLRNSPLSTRGKVGESISLRKCSLFTPDITGSEVVEQWLKDLDFYDFDTGEGHAGNFTQMVWASTTHVGFGKARSKTKCVVVAHYRPPGNIKSYYVANVLPNFALTGPRARRRSQEYLSRCRHSKTKSLCERYHDDRGRKYTLTKEISDYVDEDGHVVEKIHEIRVQGYDEDEVEHVSEDVDCTDDNSEAEITESLKSLSLSAQQVAITGRLFAKDMVAVHNSYRSRHGSLPLRHNPELTELARKWAETLVAQEELTNSHYTYRNNSLGENIAVAIFKSNMIKINVEDVVAHWYSESCNYDYSIERTSVKTVGNFTQLVWRSTKTLGAARALHDTGDGVRVVVVVMYYPPGNVLGEFLNNIKPPTSKF